MIFEENVIRARNIEYAWRDVMWCCLRNGYKYRVKRGSYVGQIRKQLENLMVVIEEPWTRPLAVSVPENCGVPAPTSEDRINTYAYEYLITDTKGEKEDYTYGQYISTQLEQLIYLLNVSKGHINQATMNIGNEESIFLDDPPCLRVVSFKVLPGKPPRLQMSIFFRSWDIFVGFPENIGGLQLLKEYVLMHLKFRIEDGPIVAYSDGAHIYEQYKDLVNTLNADKF